LQANHLIRLATPVMANGSARFGITLAHSTTFVNADGLTVMVRAVPQEHSFEFGHAPDEDE